MTWKFFKNVFSFVFLCTNNKSTNRLDGGGGKGEEEVQPT